MSETRKIAAILVADVVGYSRLAGADEDRTLARLRTLRSDRHYQRLDITGLTGVTEAQRAALLALGAIEASV